MKLLFREGKTKVERSRNLFLELITTLAVQCRDLALSRSFYEGPLVSVSKIEDQFSQPSQTVLIFIRLYRVYSSLVIDRLYSAWCVSSVNMSLAYLSMVLSWIRFSSLLCHLVLFTFPVL
jgi:hypothetical protein